MTLRFSDDGPYFPGELIDSLLAGEVVFLCGAGVSAPPMPNFPQLVERTYQEVDIMEKTKQEKMAFKNGRYEEVLTSINRNLIDPDKMISTITKLLKIKGRPNLDRHRTILRLSRDLENRICVVTTNFDTLLERAAERYLSPPKLKANSFAAQALPLPGSHNFAGILHIHGRLEDQKLGLKRSQLVVTNEHYGDAYMRSGWASRFLFDLARCKVIVIVGYSASDPPMRYFLSLLEEERGRFSDIRPVYALHEKDSKSKEAWDNLAVKSISYSKEDGHAPLWRDLKALANGIEHQKQFRQKRTQIILRKTPENTNIEKRIELDWLLRGDQILWRVALDVISDPSWFNYFEREKFCSESELKFRVAYWVGQDFQSIKRFRCACIWQKYFGDPFTKEIERLLSHKDNLSQNWKRTWRIFCLSGSHQNKSTDHYYMERRLKSDIILNSDLRKAINLLAPRPEFDLIEVPNKHNRLARIHNPSFWRMAISDPYGAKKLVNALKKIRPNNLQILQLALSELQSVLELEVELNKINQEGDCNDWDVASIEEHPQNEHREGANFLVQVISNCISQIADSDIDRARKIITNMKILPGRIGLRIFLHAVRDEKLFDTDEAMSALLSMSEKAFWTIRKEVALVIKERAKTAPLETKNKLETRILKGGIIYYNRFSIERGQFDWRPYARDAAVWLRLKMLKEAGALSDVGNAKLSAIMREHQYLNRDVEDRDLFDSYLSGVRWISGNPAPLLKTPRKSRLQEARKLAKNPDPDMRAGWLAFCRFDPQGAFDSLKEGGLGRKNLPLWRQFLNNLLPEESQKKNIHEEISIQVMAHLFSMSEKNLRSITPELCHLISFMPQKKIAKLDAWLTKLWKLVISLPNGRIKFESNLHEKAMNSPAGKLAYILLLEIEKRKQAGKKPTPAQYKLMRYISLDRSSAGYHGCAIFARHLAFLLTVNKKCVVEILAPRIAGKNNAGKSLRGVMLIGTIAPEITKIKILKDSIIQGVIKSKLDDPYIAKTVVANILRPALANLRGGHSSEWGLSIIDIKHILQKANSTTQVEILEILKLWFQNDPRTAEKTWEQTIVPFFEKVWPKERKFANELFTDPMIDLIVNTGKKFPKAYEFMQHHIFPYTRGYKSLHAITESDVPEKFPHKTLDLLWRICGPKSRGYFYDLPEVINRLIETDSSIEIDRRLQWLTQRADRYGYEMTSPD